jgi:hypothetical protein
VRHRESAGQGGGGGASPELWHSGEADGGSVAAMAPVMSCSTGEARGVR